MKEKKLQDPAAKQWFTPDATMAPVFGTEKIKMGMGFMRNHLTYCKDDIFYVSPELAKIIGSKKGEKISISVVRNDQSILQQIKIKLSLSVYEESLGLFEAEGTSGPR